MKYFDPDQLEIALALHEHVEANRWDVNNLPDDQLQFQCEFWVFTARSLLDGSLPEPDRQACLWTLSVVKAIAGGRGIYIFGLNAKHTDDWRARARVARARLVGRRKRPATVKAVAPKPKVVSTPRPVVAKPAQALPGLCGSTIVIIGDEPDQVLLERYRDAGFALDWVPGRNVRQVQAAMERIKGGRVGGVVFLADANRHASFIAMRSACQFSNTPMTLGVRGVAAMGRALQALSEARAAVRASA